MKEYKFLEKFEDIISKTIIKVSTCYDETILLFSDNTILFIQIGHDYEGGSEFRITIPAPFSIDFQEILYKLELISEKEFEKFCNKEKKKYDKIKEEREIAELKRLKLKYPNV